MSDGDNYERVMVTFLRALPSGKSVLVRSEDDRTVCVPRSLLHAGDETTIDRLAEGTEVTWQIRAWFVDKEGL